MRTKGAINAVDDIFRDTRSVLGNQEFTGRKIALNGGCGVNKRTKGAVAARIAARNGLIFRAA